MGRFVGSVWWFVGLVFASNVFNAVLFVFGVNEGWPRFWDFNLFLRCVAFPY